MRRSVCVTVVAVVLASACGGGDQKASDASSAAPASTAPASFDVATITPQMLALGDSLYHGLIGATSCQACHGPDGKGGVVAPDLTDTTWLHSDGSFESIYKQVETGVTAPKQYTSVMPPFGGAPLTPEKHLAVSAYVYSLGHKIGQ